jgi:hypothetical protein
MAQAVECPFCKYEVLSSNPSTAKKKQTNKEFWKSVLRVLQNPSHLSAITSFEGLIYECSSKEHYTDNDKHRIVKMSHMKEGMKYHLSKSHSSSRT